MQPQPQPHLMPMRVFLRLCGRAYHRRNFAAPLTRFRHPSGLFLARDQVRLPVVWVHRSVQLKQAGLMTVLSVECPSLRLKRRCRRSNGSFVLKLLAAEPAHELDLSFDMCVQG